MKVKNIAALSVFSAIGILSTQLVSAQAFDDKQFTVRLGGSYATGDDANLEFRQGDYGERYEDLKSDTTWNISAAWRPLEHFGFELMYIGNTSNELSYKQYEHTKGDKYVDFDSQASNAYVNWYPSDKNSAFQPYLGVGINYTNYDSVQLADDVGVGPDNQKGDEVYATLSDTWGATAQAGFDYYFSQNFLINAAVSYTDSSPTSTAYSKADSLELVSNESLKPNPWTFNVGVGFTF